MRSLMIALNRTKNCCFFVLLLFAELNALAQSRTVTGMVSADGTNEPLPRVTVTIKNLTRATSTNASGTFSITAEPNSVLVFTMIGYSTKEVAVDNKSIINVVLEPAARAMDEVVVVGYGTQRKRDVTGAIISLKPENFNKGASASLNQLISGKAAGVRVVQNSNEPGGGISVNIRGAGSVSAGSDPLYVIDGLPLDNTPPVVGTGRNYVSTNTPRSPLNSINPNDIESIEILKDASATAIYGARGANGVIMITTKKGKEGTPRINYSAYVGTQNVINRLRLLNAGEYMTVLNDIVANGGGSNSEKVTGIQNGGTDWQDLIYQKNALIQNHNISISGGNGKSTYFLGMNYFDQKGVVVTTGLKRYNVRLNLTSELTDKLSVGVNLTTSYTEDNFTPEGNGFNELGGTIYAALNMDPTIGVRDADGNYILSSFISIDNPLALVYGKQAKGAMYRTLGTIYGNYKITNSLVAKLNIGGDVINQRRDVYVDRSTISGVAASGAASILNGTISNYLVEGTVSYDKVLSDHHINAVVGATTQKFNTIRNSLEASGFASDANSTNNVGSGTQSTYSIGSFRASNRLVSFLGRINYSYGDKYLLTTSYRIDGSSKFGDNSKYGFFPSLALGWKIDREEFFEDVTFMSGLKLRASWGRTGNQSIPDYQSIITYASGPVAVFNNQFTSTQEPARLGNRDLKWETTQQLDLGLDFGFLKNRIEGSIDYYNKKTFDMLLNKPVPTTTGFNTQLLNIGSIKNTGWDFTLNTLNVNKALKWNTSINFSTIKNIVLDLGGIPEIAVGSPGVLGQSPGIITPGQTLYSFYGYKIAGIWQTGDKFEGTKDLVKPGDFKYVDVNGDSIVNARDRVLLGNSFPKYTWSVGNTFTYKRFSLEVFIEGVHGVSMYNNNLADVYFPINFRRNKLAEPYLNRWTSTNPSNQYPSFITPLGQGQKIVNSYTVEDASFVRLQTVTLSYQLPSINRVFRSGSLYVTGQNLWIHTNYTGMDPSVNPGGNANYRVDFNASPATATFLVGVNFDF